MFGAAAGPSVEDEERALSAQLTKKPVMAAHIAFTVVDLDNLHLYLD